MAEDIVLSERNVPRQPLHEELTRLYSQGYMTDITISTDDGKNFEAHKILLAARSVYFHSIVPRLKTDPVVFLKGVKGAHLDKILKFIYGGSVSVSKHQLKHILEVGKSLQIKGLQDVTPSEILNRQSVVSAGRFKPDSPLGSPLLSSSKIHPRATTSSTTTNSITTVDKTTLTSFRNPGKLRSSALSSFASAAAANASIGTSTRRTTASASFQHPQRQPMNGSPLNSDSEEDNKEKDDDDEDSDHEVSINTRASRKRTRGRSGKKAASSSSSEIRSASAKSSLPTKGDPYEFEEDEKEGEEDKDSGDDQQQGSPSKKGWRYQHSDKDAKKGKKGRREGGSESTRADEKEENAEDSDSQAQGSSKKGGGGTKSSTSGGGFSRGQIYAVKYRVSVLGILSICRCRTV